MTNAAGNYHQSSPLDDQPSIVEQTLNGQKFRLLFGWRRVDLCGDKWSAVTNNYIESMSMESQRNRAARVAQALIKALETVDSLPRRGVHDLHLAAEGMGYAGVLILAADLVADYHPELSDETLTELRLVAEESRDDELLEAYNLIVAPVR